MSNKIVTHLKNVGLSITLLIAIIACERDFEDLAVDLIENSYFSVGDSIFEVLAYNINVDSSRVDNNSQKIPLYLMGVNRDEYFGYKKSVLISQVYLPVAGADFGDNAVIDTVILDIPYYSTRQNDNQYPLILDDSIATPNFVLDSVYGNTSYEFNVTVSELETFLNVLDPENPTQSKAYYSDKDYQLNAELFSGDFKTNRNDTVLYVLRRGLDGDPSTINQIDTIKAPGTAPTMKFNLDEDFFQENFIDNPNQSDFSNNDLFTKFFKGLYIDSNGDDGALINVAGGNARLSIYYTNDEIENEEAGEDLNYNGIFGEGDVVVRTPQTMDFPFGGVRTGKYENNYGGTLLDYALKNPDTENGEQKLFVQGAAGTEVLIDLFPDKEILEQIRSENLLINEANLTIYIDDNQNNEIPVRLFLYNYDEKSTLMDYRDDLNIYGGNLVYDDDGNPESYKFRITFYVSDVLKLNSPKKLSKLALRNFLTSDFTQFPFLDTIVNDYNWIPKGVVLKGNLPQIDEERMKLQLYYSKAKE